MRSKIPTLLAVLLWASAGLGQAQAADYRVETAEALTSDQVPASVREALQPKGVRLLEGDTLLFELWLPAAVPVKSSGGGAGDVLYGTLTRGAWVGVLHFLRPGADFRGQLIRPGFYSLRYGHVMQDGNHMGVSVYRDFVLLAPAAEDMEIDRPLSVGETLELSRKAAGTGHPAIFSLSVPAEGKSPEQPGLVQDDMGHWVVETGSKAISESGEGAEFPFSIVLVGQAEI